MELSLTAFPGVIYQIEPLFLPTEQIKQAVGGKRVGFSQPEGKVY
jgi:hypothetical protein